MNTKGLIEKFYSSFSNGDVKEMTTWYHENMRFQEPIFGLLKGEKAIKIW
ncbi:hypothetical protein [Polaribacter sp. IC073]|nr:hypothetical protein [Polaribacter sp. IC073]